MEENLDVPLLRSFLLIFERKAPVITLHTLLNALYCMVFHIKTSQTIVLNSVHSIRLPP
jgi:hypothetical protein